MTRTIIFALALLLSTSAHAALRPSPGGGTMPTNPTPGPDVPPTSWQPPFTLLR